MMSLYLSNIITYILIALIYLYLSYASKQVFTYGLYNVYPIHLGFVFASILLLCISGIIALVGGKSIPSLHILIVGILVLVTALWVFVGVDTHILVILFSSTLIVGLSILSGIGGRYIFDIMTFNRFLLYVFIALSLGFIIQQVLARR